MACYRTAIYGSLTQRPAFLDSTFLKPEPLQYRLDMESARDVNGDARRLVEGAWRLRKLTIWFEALIGVPAMIVGFWLWGNHFVSDMTKWLLIFSPFLIAIPLVAYRYLTQRTRPRAAVLWVRRFHRGSKATAEQKFLEFAVVDWGQLITLADDCVDTDVASRMMLTWKYYVVVAALLAITVVITHSGTAMFVGGLAGFGVFLLGRRRRARVNLGDERVKLTKIVRAMRSRRMPSSASVVLRCPRDSDLWREVIVELSQTIDAAILSPAEGSPQVDWEVRTLANSLGAEKMIVLTYGGEPGLPLSPSVRVLNIPTKIPWWAEQHWRSAAVTVGSAILTSRRPSIASEDS